MHTFVGTVLVHISRLHSLHLHLYTPLALPPSWDCLFALACVSVSDPRVITVAATGVYISYRLDMDRPFACFGCGRQASVCMCVSLCNLLVSLQQYYQLTTVPLIDCSLLCLLLARLANCLHSCASCCLVPTWYYGCCLHLSMLACVSCVCS